MDEIIPGLWIGDLPSALNVQQLKEHNIYSILSAMRGRVTINETFIRHQILLDDTEEADILVHFLPSITFIQTELDKGRGVLVHCHAGMSRSVTIVAAYLMYTRNLDPEAALELIKQSRPNISPNDGFLRQLEIFYQAAFNISRRDKTTRMFYMERAVEEVMNGDGSLLETDMFAKFPRTPTDSAPATPGGPRRRIRCKMCRQELATREHMLDHGQLGPATPAAGATPAASRRPSMNDVIARRASSTLSRRPSLGQPRSRLGSTNDTRPNKPSGLNDPLSMSALETEDDPEEEQEDTTPKARYSVTESQFKQLARRSSGGGSDSPRLLPIRPFMNLSRGVLDSLSMSALETEDDSDGEPLSPQAASNQGIRRGSATTRPSLASLGAATRLGRRLSDAVIAFPDRLDSTVTSPVRPTMNGEASSDSVEHSSSQYASPSDLAAQLYANPKLAALRSPMVMTPMGMTPMKSPSISPPIIVNPKCSGYFVEPMKWMEPFLQSGQLAGKIICPNKKCGAKLGNYDWAGVCCSCKEWVTPGFCIHRSKVDEIV